ncbi:pyridoxamine 5'-phosphate oxidase family protein [Sediminibacillus halophilus]|uniref:General stress protein 26 n=1 Tax=Sediminibacillus halophilus TaxID=482461 RepID=A0A1G9X209_9BACI|nr:pyridoxamine 5'-phosphate oxidase family protein [Sediminibacillus halophilus]SDM90748.1 General stress protein 26 [Sediminibacillus halophilus]
MEQNQIRDKVASILDSNLIGTMATVKKDKPFSRYMTFFNEEFTLYTATDKDTHKVEDIDKNNNVHILLGYKGEGLEDAYLEIEGTAAIKESSDIKKKLWNNKLEAWFKGPDDPDYIVLEIKPTEIRLMNTKEGSPQVLGL